MRRYSKKRAKIERELRKVKQDIVDTHEGGCEGCAKTNCAMEFSHIIPRSRRADLIAVRENINVLCHSCHATWETHVPAKMKALDCYDANMAYIKEVDHEYYQILINK